MQKIVNLHETMSKYKRVVQYKTVRMMCKKPEMAMGKRHIE